MYIWILQVFLWVVLIKLRPCGCEEQRARCWGPRQHTAQHLLCQNRECGSCCLKARPVFTCVRWSYHDISPEPDPLSQEAGGGRPCRTRGHHVKMRGTLMMTRLGKASPARGSRCSGCKELGASRRFQGELQNSSQHSRWFLAEGIKALLPLILPERSVL